jgi:hypothetical protein
VSRTAESSPREARGLSGKLNVLVTGSSAACRQSIITDKLIAASSMLFSGGITRVSPTQHLTLDLVISQNKSLWLIKPWRNQ